MATEPTAGPKKPRDHPSVHCDDQEDIIVTLEEKTGSSLFAITKFIEQKRKQLPPNFKKLLMVYLEKLVRGKIVKVKGLFKFPGNRLSVPNTAVVKPKTLKLTIEKKPKAGVKQKSPTKAKATPLKLKLASKSKSDTNAKRNLAKVARTSNMTTLGKKVAYAKHAPKKAVAEKAPVKR